MVAHIIQTRRADILQLAKEHGATDVRVFGSAARGDVTEGSDIDLLVRMQTGRNFLDFVGLWQDLEDLLCCRVDLLADGGINPHLADRILAEAVPL